MVVIKQICFNPDNGRLILSDSDNNHFLCDIYGHKQTIFLPYISGCLSGRERQELSGISPPLHSLSNSSYIEYYPITRRFEGYSQFPRPLVPPFSNIPTYEIKDSGKNELIEQLQKYFAVDKTKSFLNLTNDNKALDYLTADLNSFDTVKEDSEVLLTLIEDTFAEYRKLYKYKLNVLHNNPTIRALKEFQKVLMNNSNMKIINGRRLKEPCDKIINNYNSINKVINRFGLHSPKRKFHINKREHLSRELPVMLFKSAERDYIKERKKVKFGEFLYENQKNKEMQEKKKEEKKVEEKKEEEKKEENEENEKKVKKVDSRNVSFISNVTENDANYAKENIMPIKKSQIIEKNFEREMRLLSGFKEEIRKEETIIRKTKPPKIKSNGELYLENLALLKKTNPIAYKLQEERDELDLKQLKRKLKQSKINQSNSGYDIKKLLKSKDNE